MSVELDVVGSVAYLTMARPEALNAFDAPMIDRMRACIARVASDRSVRAVVLAGQGRSFCTGVDVKGLREGSVRLDWFRAWHHMTADLEGIEVPVIAAIQGHCLGGGLMLTLTADYRLAGDDLRIGLGAVRHGILPGSAPQRLAGIVGGHGRDGSACSGSTWTAPRRCGSAWSTVSSRWPSSATEPATLAERAASFSPTAIRELKRLLPEAPALDDAGYEVAYLSAQERCLDDEHGQCPARLTRSVDHAAAERATTSTDSNGASTPPSRPVQGRRSSWASPRSSWMADSLMRSTSGVLSTSVVTMASTEGAR